jgi:glycosyltransferase involved in cell wall biosynthesis
MHCNQCPLISIIIPVYQVEKYLDKCIASVVNQTYTNLEIILVDDGSPDNCPAICDAWKERDPRIKVIHQENGGLSVARNNGIDVCRGLFVQFVDSDDYIEPNTVECLLQACFETNAEVSCCGYVKEYANRIIYHPITDGRKCYEGEEILVAAMKGTVFEHLAWNKLWRRELFDNDCRFPPGKCFEDSATTWKVLRKCSRVICVPDVLYHYIVRKYSISNTKSMKHFLDCWDACKERFDEMSVKSEMLRQICMEECFNIIGYIWRWLYLVDKKDRDEVRLQKMQAFLQENRDNIALCPIPTRFSLFCALHSNPVTILGCYFVNQIYRRLHGMGRMM